MPIHLPTVLIIAVLALFFGLLIYSLIRDKKKGKSSCCGGCAGCAMAGQCHPQASTDGARTPTETNREDPGSEESDPK